MLSAEEKEEKEEYNVREILDQFEEYCRSVVTGAVAVDAPVPEDAAWLLSLRLLPGDPWTNEFANKIWGLDSGREVAALRALSWLRAHEAVAEVGDRLFMWLSKEAFADELRLRPWLQTPVNYFDGVFCHLHGDDGGADIFDYLLDTLGMALPADTLGYAIMQSDLAIAMLALDHGQVPTEAMLLVSPGPMADLLTARGFTVRDPTKLLWTS